jgi:alpha-methylacyl-CoA racemase
VCFENSLDSGAPFYDTFKTKDGKYMAVGSLEPQFYVKLMEGLSLELDQFTDFEENREIITREFLKKSQEEWTHIFDSLDACVTPVLDLEEAPKHPQNNFRKAFVQNPHTMTWEPEPAPKLSRTPGKARLESPDPAVGEHTVEILKESGYDSESIRSLLDAGTVETAVLNSKL